MKRFETDFGGKGYVAFIHSLPCDVCGLIGHSDAAHLTSRGAGGKAKDVAPLCRNTLTYFGHQVRAGCHQRYDLHDPEIRKHEPRLRKLAAERWQEYNNTQEKPQ